MSKSHRFVNLAGKQFGRLTAMWPAGRSGRSLSIFWTCSCSCGNYHTASGFLLKRGDIKGCGCVRRDWANSGTAHTTHGFSKSPEYQAYNNAKDRCTNPSDKGYKNYGGRGIKFKFSTFSKFLSEVGTRPTPEHSIDRINNDGHYESGNLRWATRLQQRHNRRPNGRITLPRGIFC